uniref:Putative secreted protein n=1 Tax=Anopheles darlingi TaxID=43151 RepID=A0A2M4DIH4_ANODA
MVLIVLRNCSTLLGAVAVPGNTWLAKWPLGVLGFIGKLFLDTFLVCSSSSEVLIQYKEDADCFACFDQLP